jgi:glyoxylase-like metal-dependent hydrolase (beta-lactamase superfamily II)
MRLYQGVHQIGVKMARGTDLFVYLFTGKNSILLDTGIAQTPSDAVAPYLGEIGLKPSDLTLALITHGHPDHFGGNSDLKALSPKTLLAVHHKDAGMASDPEMAMKLGNDEFRKDHDVFYWDHVKDDVWNTIRAMMGSPVPIDLLLSGGDNIPIKPFAS